MMLKMAMLSPRKVMSRKVIAFTLCLCTLLNACGKADYHTADGASGHFADLRGKWLLINYWAQWCKPCIEEIPELNRFHKEFSARATVLAVNYDNAQGEQLLQQIKQLHIELPVLQQDPSTQLGYPLPEVLPTTFVFNPEGKLTATLIGPQTVESLTAAINQAP